MRRLLSLGLVIGLLTGLTLQAGALTRVYKWVKDKQVDSNAVLSVSNSSRVVALTEPAALAAARNVMTKNLYMALAEYHKTKHIQDGETTKEVVLPEEVVGRQDIELFDEDFRFLLEVRFKAFGGRTRVIAKASPVYRIHDVDAEESANGESSSSSIEVKVKGGRVPATVAMGPMFIVPFEGSPLTYQVQPVPDAAERAAMLVRSFMFLLDKEVSANKKGGTTAPAETEAPKADAAAPKAETSTSSAAPAVASTDTTAPSAAPATLNTDAVPGAAPAAANTDAGSVADPAPAQ